MHFGHWKIFSDKLVLRIQDEDLVHDQVQELENTGKVLISKQTLLAFLGYISVSFSTSRTHTFYRYYFCSILLGGQILNRQPLLLSTLGGRRGKLGYGE